MLVAGIGNIFLADETPPPQELRIARSIVARSASRSGSESAALKCISGSTIAVVSK
jgi:hypothetical protein